FGHTRGKRASHPCFDKSLSRRAARRTEVPRRILGGAGPISAGVVQAWEAAGLGGAAEAVEGAQRHVRLVRGGARPAAEPLAGQADQAAEVALPQRLRGGAVALLEPPRRERHVPGPPDNPTR